MRALLSLTTIALLSSGPALAQSAFPDDAAIGKLLKDRVEDERATGLVVGVLDADGKTRIVSYGSGGPGAEKLGPDTVFEIGSITKVFTASVLADMAQKGEVKLDVPAQTYAPAGMTLPKRGDKQITLANLSEQNSGLPRMPSNFAPKDAMNPYADYTAGQLNTFLSSYALTRDIGERFEYSNLGMGTLGAILSNKAGRSYEALVSERVLKPLNMTMTGVTLSPPMSRALAKGHDEAGAVTANWDLPALAGAGALRSNMTDMLKFLDANVGPPKNDLERAMREAQRVRAPAGPMQIGLNWLHSKSAGGVEYVWHNGGTGGYRSFIGFDPKRNVGVVVLSNRAIPADDIGVHLLDAKAPLAVKPAPPAQRTEVSIPAEQKAKFVGTYALNSAPAFQITVTVENGALFAVATQQPKFPVFAESATRLFYRVVDAQLEFTGEKDGAFGGLVLHQGGLSQPFTRTNQAPQ